MALRISTSTLARYTITPSALATAFKIPVDVIFAMVDAGYLCPVYYREGKSSFGRYKIAIAKGVVPPKSKPDRIRVVDRASIMLWLLGMDRGRTIPVFHESMELEIMRIARLKEPWRTEQALRLVLRYRDAKTVAGAITRLRSNDIEIVDIQRRRVRYERKLERMAGLTTLG